MGVEVTGRDLVAVVVRLPDTGAAAVRACSRPPRRWPAACRNAGVPALVGALDDVRAGALLSLPPGADAGEPLRRSRAGSQPGSAQPAPGPVIGAGLGRVAARGARRVP